MVAYPNPTGGASLLLSFRLQGKTVLIIGSGPLAASRAFAALEADASVIVLARGGLDGACEELKWRAQQGQVTIFDLTAGLGHSSELEAIESHLSRDTDIHLVCVTETILGNSSSSRRRSVSKDIHRLCTSRNIPVNFTDLPNLCDFSFASTHRFVDPDTREKTSLQVGVTTNGKGCRLAGRLRREIVARLPKEAGPAIEKIGALRAHARSRDEDDLSQNIEDDSVDTGDVISPLEPSHLLSPSAGTPVEAEKRRMRWVSQISEYWPIERIAKISTAEMETLLSSRREEPPAQSFDASSPLLPSLHSLDVSPSLQKGKIILAGSGPGLPSLLTIASHTALTQQAQLVLSDKLVPAPILALVPSGVEVRIARKFPGNADGAQEEMMEAAVEAAKRGLTVVRLKQGDPAIYGRVGEELLYFRTHGFEPLVIPGVSSAIAGPMFAGISVTQRGAAESFAVCTGVGRKGKGVQLPGYERGRTLVLLMGVARLRMIVSSLLDVEGGPGRAGAPYPPYTPIAIIERASMPDQRVIESTLQDVLRAVECSGEHRPPGMLVVGWTVLALWGKGDVGLLDEGPERDVDRVRAWLAGADESPWRVREGLPRGWLG